MVEIHEDTAKVEVHKWSTGNRWSPEFVVRWEPRCGMLDEDDDFPDEVEETFQTLDEAFERARVLLYAKCVECA